MAEGPLPPIVLEIVAKANELKSGLREAGGEVEKFETKTKTALAGAAQVGKAALLGLGGAAVAVGGFALEMADKFEISRTRLEGAIANAGGKFEELKGQVAAVDAQMEKFGFTNATTEGSLASLTSATHNPTQAMNLMGLAANIAKGRNIDLATATGILIKVQTGHVAALGRLGIATKDASGKTISQAEALRRLSQMYAGDAARSTKTFAGETAAVKAKVEDLGAKLGMALIPIIQKTIDITMNVVGWFQKHKEVAEILGIAIAGPLVAAIGAFVIELGVAAVESVSAAATMVASFLGIGEAAVTTGEETTVALGPIGIIVAAIGVAAFELYQHWNQVWGFIKRIAEDAWHFIDSNLVQPLQTGFGVLKDALTGYWHLTVSVWNDIKGVFTDAVKWISGKVSDFVGFFTGLPGRMAGLFVGMFDGIKDAFRAAINFVIRGWNDLHFRMPSVNTHIPGVGKIGGWEIGLPQIPLLAQGGNVQVGGLAMVGERGPEVLSLPAGAQVTPLSRGAGGDLHIHLDGPVFGDRTKVAKELASAIRDELLRMGRGLPNLGLG